MTATPQTSIAVLDPRMPPSDEVIELAPRMPTRPGDRIILYDNGKLASNYGAYAVFFDVFEREIATQLGGVVALRRGTDLLGHSEDTLKEIAGRIALERPAGVVFALCDWGVSFTTAIVAAELERLGVPTVVIGTGPGYGQAKATGARIAPGLPVLETRLLRASTPNELEVEAMSLFPAVLSGLTAAPAAEDDQRAPRATADGYLTVTGDDPAAELTAMLAADGLGDGFPLMLPTRPRVDAFLDAGGRTPDDVIWPRVSPRPCPVTAEQVATIAVLAGCQPRWAAVVFAAYEAMADVEFRLFVAAMTTFPGGTLVLVSGPGADEFGVASGSGCLGPGFAANASIGRAVSLGYSFLLGAQPGGSDLTAQGSPAEFAYCCAENLAESPWPGLHIDLGYPDDTTVTVVKCEGPHSILDQQSAEPHRLLDTFASTMATLGGNPTYAPSCPMPLFMNPEHAQLLAQAGWSKADVRHYLFEKARSRRSDIEARGIEPMWPHWYEEIDEVPVFTKPENLLLAVVGGAGPTSQVAPPWGYARAVTRPVRAGR